MLSDPRNKGRLSTPKHLSPYTLVEVEPAKEVNTQLYENSGIPQHPVAQAAATDPDRLFNAVEDNPPNLAVLTEQPWHRLVVYLKGQGLSNRDIAHRVGKTEAWISQITRQPWFRLRLVQELREAGVDQIHAVLKANALDSVFTLVEIRDDATAPKAVRKSAADSLLDRYLGKPVQKTEHEDKRTPSTQELHSLDQEIQKIEKELNNES